MYVHICVYMYVSVAEPQAKPFDCSSECEEFKAAHVAKKLLQNHKFCLQTVDDNFLNSVVSQ